MPIRAVQAPALKISPIASQLLSEKVRRIREKTSKKRAFFMMDLRESGRETKHQRVSQNDTDLGGKRLRYYRIVW